MDGCNVLVKPSCLWEDYLHRSRFINGC